MPPANACLWVLLQKEAKEGFDQAIGWCVSLITDYRVRLGTWGPCTFGQWGQRGRQCRPPGRTTWVVRVYGRGPLGPRCKVRPSRLRGPGGFLEGL